MVLVWITIKVTFPNVWVCRRHPNVSLNLEGFDCVFVSLCSATFVVHLNGCVLWNPSRALIAHKICAEKNRGGGSAPNIQHLAEAKFTKKRCSFNFFSCKRELFLFLGLANQYERKPEQKAVINNTFYLPKIPSAKCKLHTASETNRNKDRILRHTSNTNLQHSGTWGSTLDKNKK